MAADAGENGAGALGCSVSRCSLRWWWTLPRLWRFARHGSAQASAALPAEVRASATYIAVALPVQAVMLGAMTVFFYTCFTELPLSVNLILMPTLLAVAGISVQGVRLLDR